uniref:cytochrome c oxidase subunit III n=1 Tax=Jogocerus viraktamathi TaxID=3111112 RepID=UPI002E774C35|nr:cytochrome c oxidase subunit III [Jogocerus viraktamathi]WRK19231.1 cytochrome c oxidase subunit III [Jogocerus viraktamathi]
MNNHPYHLVDNSPWPLILSLGLMTTVSGSVMYFMYTTYNLIILGLVITILSLTQWWRDVTRESTFQGMHTSKVMISMKLGMIMFIISEIMFFTSFFWAFFHSSLSPNVEIGLQWPPKGLKPFNPMNIPFLNTLILLTSGVTITWSHSSLLNKNYSQIMKSMILTFTLGIYFSMLQLYEYMEAPFSISDSIYGATFYMSTGFHGIHVIIGTVFIIISTLRSMKLHFSKNHHIGFEMSAWYWHFVDIVWMFLYISIYWWGS